MRFRLSDRTIDIRVDAEHVAAHRADFVIPFRRVLGYVARALDERPRGVRLLLRDDDPARVRRWVALPEVVGLSGVVRAGPKAFWGHRVGREIPSHLVHGRKRRTRRLTFYGCWDGAGRFLLRTVYAGNPAPREIHDPRIPLSELPEAVAFWSRHAIVVGPDDHGPVPPAMPRRGRRPRAR